MVAGLIGCAPVGAVPTFVAGTPFGKSEHPVCQGATGGAVFLDGIFSLRVRQLTFVDEERPPAAAAFALEHVCGHRKA